MSNNPDTSVTQIAGNLGDAFEEAQTNAGEVIRLRVAVTKSYKQRLTVWVRVTVFNDGLRKFIKDNPGMFAKGMPVAIEGYMKAEPFNGKMQYNMTAYKVGAIKWGVSTPRNAAAGNEATGTTQSLGGW